MQNGGFLPVCFNALPSGISLREALPTIVSSVHGLQLSERHAVSSKQLVDVVLLDLDIFHVA